MERIKNLGRKIRDRQFVKRKIQEHDSFETPEDRFRNFLTDGKLAKDSIKIKNEINELLKKEGKTVVKQVIDKSLQKIDINFKIKLEAQFEKDYPGRKAICKGKTTGLFKKWLKEHNQFNNYFNKPNSDIKPRYTFGDGL